MSGNQIKIPKHSKADVAFAGVEFKDVYLLIGGLLFGVIVGGFFHGGLIAFLGIPLCCFLLNTWYLDWKENATPGQLRGTLYRYGLVGYSRAFPTANMVYVGDSKALNPASRKLLEQANVQEVA